MLGCRALEPRLRKEESLSLSSPHPSSVGSQARRQGCYHTVFLFQLKCFHSVLQMVLEAVPEPLR